MTTNNNNDFNPKNPNPTKLIPDDTDLGLGTDTKRTTSDSKTSPNDFMSHFGDDTDTALQGEEAVSYGFADEALGIEETRLRTKDPTLLVADVSGQLVEANPEPKVNKVATDDPVTGKEVAERFQVAFLTQLPPAGDDAGDGPEVLTPKKKAEKPADGDGPEVLPPKGGKKADEPPPSTKPEVLPPPREVREPAATKDVKPEVKEAPEDLLARKQVESIQQRLDKILAKLPEKVDKEPTTDQVRKKVEAELAKDPSKRDFASLSNAELRKAIELEATEPGFGKKTGFRLTELAYQRANLQINSAVIDAEMMLAKSGLSRMAGDPITVSTIGTNPDNPTEGFAHRPETFASLIQNGDVDIKKIIELCKSGHIGGGNLILEPKGIPSINDLNKMDNSLDWINQNTGRLSEARERILANGAYYILTDVIGVKNKPEWAPPKNPNELGAYFERMTDACNLIYSVRNYADCINNLNKTKGDFNSKALEEFEKRGLGKIEFDDKGRITKFDIKLPKSLAPTPENEREFQKLRDWLKEFGGPADQLMKEYKNANFIRYMDVMQKGTVAIQGEGDDERLAAVYDDKGEMTCRILKDGTAFNRDADGELIDAQGNKITNEQLVDGAAEFESFPSRHFKKNDKGVYVDDSGTPATREDFLKAKLGERKTTDYFNQWFTVENKGGKVIVHNHRDYYEDHAANYNYWFGLDRGKMSQDRTYNFDDFAVCQNQSGKLQPVRADELQNFKAMQAFFHHGAKFASLALDVGMIVSGSVGARAALQAGKALYVATNVGRVILGVGGFLDPAFRQMGDAGQAIRTARHYAILFDVTQGLGRQAIGKAFGLGKPWLTPGSAMEVQKVIEQSAAMHRAEVATKCAFVAADGVWLPLMGSGAKFKIDRMRGQNPVEFLDTAAISRGGGTEGSDVLQKTYADIVKKNPDVAKVAEKLFGVYGPMVGDKGKPIFDQTVASLKAKDVNPQLQEMLKHFFPNHDELMKWKKEHRHQSAERFPKGDQKPEIGSDQKEKVAMAISLLMLAQKDGKLPENGVLAERVVPLESYKYKSGKHMKTVEAENITQQIKTQDVLEILQRSTLDSSDPATQLVAADALWRTGTLPTGRYAGVCLDVINNPNADKELRYKAMRQMSDLLVRKHDEEGDTTMDPKAKAKLESMDYLVSEEHLKEALAKFAGGSDDKDLRAFATAVLHAHKDRVNEGKEEAAAREAAKKEGKEPPKEEKKESAIDKWDALWKKCTAEGNKDAFYEAVVTDLKTQMSTALPPIDSKESAKQIAEFDKTRESKLRATESFMALEKDSPDNTVLINKTLTDCIKLGTDWPANDYGQRPNVMLTARVLDTLVKRSATTTLDSDQTKQMFDAARGIVRAKFAVYDAGGEEKDPNAAAKATANTDAAFAKMLVLGQVKDILKLRDKEPTYFGESDMFRLSIQTLLRGDSHWSDHAVMRVAAIKGLVPFGPGPNNANLQEIAKHLNIPPWSEGSPHVRTAAVRAIAAIDSTYFSKSVKDAIPGADKTAIKDESLATSLLRKERDPAALDTIWRMHDQSVTYQNPEDVKTIGEYDREVGALVRAKNITISPTEVAQFLNKNKALLKGFTEAEVTVEALNRSKKELWSGFGGWWSHTFSSNETIEAREKLRASTVEAPELRKQRNADIWPNLKNFKDMQDPETAIKLLMTIVRDRNNPLFTQGEEPGMRIKAAQYLRDLSEYQRDAGDLVQNKQLLADCITSALLHSEVTMPHEAKLALLQAIDNLTDRTIGVDVNKGASAKDVSLLTPEQAGLIFTKVLEREHLDYGKAPQNSDLQKQNEQVQLKCIELINKHRYLGSFAVLAARGPSAMLDPANPGSQVGRVKEVAQRTVQDLFYGVNWIREDAKKIAEQQVKTSPKQDAININNRLKGDLDHNGEYVCKDIFASVERNKITDLNDPRLQVLGEALQHVNPRIRLAAAMALAESKLPPDSEPIKQSVRTLTGLIYDPGVMEFPKATATAALRDLQKARHGVEVPEHGGGTVAWLKESTLIQAPKGTLEEQAKAISEAVKNSEYIFLTPDAVAQRLKPEDLKPNSPFYEQLKLSIEKRERDKGLKPTPKEVEDLANAKMERLKQADQTDRNRQTGDTLAAKRVAEEEVLVKIFSSFRTNKIEREDDPRREVLKDLLKHKSDRISLTAALILADSKFASDRDAGVYKIAELGMSSQPTHSEALEHLIQFCSSSTNSREAKIETMATWNRAFEKLSRAEWFCPQLLVEERLRPPPELKRIEKVVPIETFRRPTVCFTCHPENQPKPLPRLDLMESPFFKPRELPKPLTAEELKALDKLQYEGATDRWLKASTLPADNRYIKKALHSEDAKTRYQAALIMATSPIGFNDADRQEGARALALISVKPGEYQDSAQRAIAGLPDKFMKSATEKIIETLKDPNQGVQYEAAKYLFQSADKSITADNKKNALVVLGQASASGDAALAERARELMKTVPDKHIAVASALETSARKYDTADSADDKAAVNKNLTQLTPLIANLPYSAEVEAKLFGMITQIEAAGDKKLLDTVRNYLNRSDKPPIKDATDPRIEAMRKALEAKDPEIRFSAIQSLLDARNENIALPAVQQAAKTLGVMSIVETGDANNRANDMLKALPDSQRLHAISGKVSCMISQPENVQFDAALDILNSTDPLIDNSQTILALRTMGKLYVSDNSDVALKASKFIESSSDKDKAVAVASSVATLDSRIAMSRTDEQKELAYAKLAGLSDLVKKSAYSVDLESRLYSIVGHAEAHQDKDLVKTVRDYVDRRDPKHEKSPIKSPDDPRVKTMGAALDAKDSGIKYSAAIGLLDPKNENVPRDVQEKARSVLYNSVKKSFEELKELEKKPNADSEEISGKLDELEKVLEHLGAKNDDYALNYVRLMKLERMGGQEAQLVPVYERLAEISKQRGASDAVRMFTNKAERAKFASSDEPTIKTARTNHQNATNLANNALNTNNQDDLRKAESKLKESIDEIKKLYGKDNSIVADSMSTLAKFYAAQGRYEDAERITKDIMDIYDNEQAARLPSPVRSDLEGGGGRGRAGGDQPDGAGTAPGADPGTGAGTLPGADPTKVPGTTPGATSGTGTGALPGPGSGPGPDRGSKVLAGQRYGGEKKEFALDNKEVLNDLVDFVLSTRAIGDDSTRDAREVVNKRKELLKEVYGPVSPQYADALMKTADFQKKNFDGPVTEADNAYREAANIFGQTGDFGRQAEATAERGMLYKNRGLFDESEKIFEDGLQQLANNQHMARDRNKVMKFLKDFHELAMSKGDLALQQRIEAIGATYQNGAGLDPSIGKPTEVSPGQMIGPGGYRPPPPTGGFGGQSS